MKIKSKHTVSRNALIQDVQEMADAVEILAGSKLPADAAALRNHVRLQRALLVAVLRQAKLPAEVEITHTVDE